MDVSNWLGVRACDKQTRSLYGNDCTLCMLPSCVIGEEASSVLFIRRLPIRRLIGRVYCWEASCLSSLRSRLLKIEYAEVVSEQNNGKTVACFPGRARVASKCEYSVSCTECEFFAKHGASAPLPLADWGQHSMPRVYSGGAICSFAVSLWFLVGLRTVGDQNSHTFRILDGR